MSRQSVEGVPGAHRPPDQRFSAGASLAFGATSFFPGQVVSNHYEAFVTLDLTHQVQEARSCQSLQ